MKTITKTFLTIGAVAGLSFTTAQAAIVVYDQDFSTDPGAVAAAGNNNTVGPGLDIEYGEVAYSSLLGSFSTAGGVMDFTQSGLSADTQNAAAIFLDTSSFEVGTYLWTFDILNFTAGGANTEASYSVFEGNNAGGGDPLTVRLGSANDPSALFPIEDADGASTFSQIGSKTTFSANGSYTLEFTLTEAGTAGDFLALSWSSNETADQAGVANAIFQVDNIQLSFVPEPSSTALLGLGGLALMLRRKRS